MELTLNELFIIESLRPADDKTGTDLHHHLTVTEPLPIPVQLFTPVTAAELLALLHEIAAAAERTPGWIPVLHIEVHGCKEGCCTTSGEFLSWEEVSVPLRRLNIAIRNSLVVTLAACKGGYLATSAALHPTEPAPFFGLIGPDDVVWDDDLKYGFRKFFATLVSTQQFHLALEELQRNSLPEYRSFHCGVIFRNGIEGYRAKWLHGPLMKYRLSGMMKKHAKAGTHRRRGKKVSRREVARFLRDDSERLERYWKRFIMADIYPENLARFAPLKPDF